MNLTSREQALVLELVKALGSSLDLSKVLPPVEAVLSRLISADCFALCVSKLGRPTDYDWMTTGMPVTYFARYQEELAAKDFVRGAVVRQPNVVLRDTEMLPRQKLVRSLLYQRGRELGVPLEHVMAVLLDTDPAWHGGVTLYRERHRSFSDHDRALLKFVTPHVAQALQNCRRFSQETSRRQLLDAAVHRQGLDCLVLAPTGTEVMRTDRATALLEHWFKPAERNSSGVPQVLMERLARLVSKQDNMECEPNSWEHRGPDRDLRMTCVRLPEDDGGTLWAWFLEELHHVPAVWRQKLTPGEIEVVRCMLQDWDNKLTAQELNVKVGTVKTHGRKIFKELGAERRGQLISQATLLFRKARF